MTVMLPNDLQKKSDEMHSYLLPNGDWKPGTPDFIKGYKEEIYDFIKEQTRDSED